MWKTFLSALLFGLVHKGLTQCPEEVDILPCRCEAKPYLIIECKNIHNGEDLERVFQNVQGYSFDRIFIENSSLRVLPHNLFAGVRSVDLFLRNLTLGEFFNAPPEGLESLECLVLDQLVILRGEIWKYFQPLVNLKYLYLYSTKIESLGEDFNRFVTKGLLKIVLLNTNTRTLEPGVFSNFSQLDGIEVSDSPELTKISRNAFPNPYNGRFFLFVHNGISVLPSDIFHNMPNLVMIRMMNNSLTTFPETTFGENLYGIRLAGNPLNCDCGLEWLSRWKPQDLNGTCVAPEKMSGTRLKDLEPSHFNC